MADNRLVTVANELLVNIASGLEAEGIDVPQRRFIHSGDIAADFVGEKCADQFIVSWSGSFQGQPPIGSLPVGAPIKCAAPLSASFLVVLLRCVPTLDMRGQPPSAADLQASAEEILTDAMTLPVVIINEQLQQDLIESIGCSLLGIGDVSPFGPQGAVGGTVVQLMMALV